MRQPYTPFSAGEIPDTPPPPVSDTFGFVPPQPEDEEMGLLDTVKDYVDYDMSDYQEMMHLATVGKQDPGLLTAHDHNYMVVLYFIWLAHVGNWRKVGMFIEKELIYLVEHCQIDTRDISPQLILFSVTYFSKFPWFAFSLLLLMMYGVQRYVSILEEIGVDPKTIQQIINLARAYESD